MADELGLALVDQHGCPVLNPIAGVEIAGSVSLNGKIQGQVAMSKHKGIHGIILWFRKPVYAVLIKMFFCTGVEWLICVASASTRPSLGKSDAPVGMQSSEGFLAKTANTAKETWRLTSS